MAVHVDDLLRELEASMEEFGVAEQPSSLIVPPGSPTVAQVLASGGSGAVTGHLSLAQDGAWNRIFAVLASDSLSLFASADPTETRTDLIAIGPTSILYDAIPDGPLCFEVADSADNKSWMLMASSKTAKDSWVSKLRSLTRRDSGHSDASSEDNWAHQQQKIVQLASNQPIGLRTESRPHYRAPMQLPRLNSDSSNASSNLNAMQQQYQQYSQSLSTWKAAADMHNLRRGSDGPGSHSLFSLTSDARSIAASESSSHHSLGSAGVRGGGVFGHNDGRTSPIPSVHSSNSGSEKYGVLNMFSGGASSASSGRSKSLTGKRQENKQENKLFSNLEDSGLF
ncbi:hypothetical protein BC830DRAFT_1095561 [Chytriomyces sp. MP71]|nr:hypothetical protein BC830DRAFT_1095561 [Chytriomyces sp. MP71]